ncbi:hypothetical protein PHMEG_00022405 [Phytophthora megakarya]|uniref:Uncharacterized protein n=1 Tax=Phytophthora megakarya TaxID=4795 RepID=A0A225VIU9_9STRA|nr:hypothetical protein PHMEG_00022405 [Phytophthora megakarya]
MLVCTRGWSRKHRSNGIRKSYIDRDTDCKANVKAGSSWNEAEKKFLVRGTDASATPITKSKMQGLTTMLQTVASMIRRWSHFLTSFRQQGLNPSLLCNTYENRPRRRGGVSVAKRLETVMRDFWQNVRVIVIVRDMGELSLLEKEFDDVKMILCHFHVKTISEQRWKRTNTVANRALTWSKSKMPSI